MDGAPPPDMDTMDTMDSMDTMDTKNGKATGRAGGRAMDNGQSHSNGQLAVATVTARPIPSMMSFSSLLSLPSLASFQARPLQR